MTAPQSPADPTPTPQPAPEPPKPTPPAPKPAESDGKPAEGPNGYPENTPVAEMTVAQQAAYWRTQSKKHEAGQKSLREQLDGLKPKADQYDALLDSTRSEQERAIEEARKTTEASVKAQAAVDLAGQRLHGLLMARGKSEDEADAIVEDLNLSKYVKDGKPDREGLRAAAERLAPKVEPAPAPRVDLGQGPRGGTTASGTAAGRDLYAARHPKKSGTT